jgi:outer membrane protein assembly factor BamB
MRRFATGGHTVYHLRPATVAPDQRVVISATYDGYVLCHTLDGQPIWKTQMGGHFPYDLAVADVDADGCDEALVATAAGILYAVDSTGDILWTFDNTAPLFQVCTARLQDGSLAIVTGGVGQVLYVLSPEGKVMRTIETKHCIRHVRSGDMLGEGRDYVAVATTNRGLSGTLSLLLLDPADMNVRWKQTNLGTHAHNSGKRFFSMAVLDLDQDGRDDILLSNSWGENGRIFAFDHAGNLMYNTSDKRIPNISYRMNLLDPVKLPDDAYVIGHFGNVLIVYNLDGSCREVLTGPYSFADGIFDPVTLTYYLGSSVSGGDGIYALQLDNPGWRHAYKQIKPIGKLAALERNIQILTKQIAAFKAPAYQPAPRKAIVLSREPEGATYRHLTFIRGATFSQKYERRNELWNRDIDRRRRYNMTANEIVAAAQRLESADRAFVVWSGHGHAAHMPLSTFKRMIEAAPERLWGLEFAEMEGVDDHMQEVVEKILLPVAQLCRQHGKKIIFRNKNIFWNGTSYVPYWRRVLLDSGFEDVFIPALEETNCRTAELSLAGRVGLWLSGSFNQWSCRMVTDNANFDRMWEWAGHQVINHHLRHLASRASLGADVFFNSIHQGPFSNALYKQLIPFYDMLEKGIIRIPQKDELLSVPDVCIGMKSPPSEDYIRHGVNGHDYRYPEDTQPQMVFDRLDCYWAGSPLPPHDLSNYGLGLDRRMCNYLPTLPYGLVPILPDDFDIEGTRFRRKISTDGQYFYAAGGKQVTAATYRPVMERLLKASAGRLPVLASGDAHWSVVRLDPTHVRVTLIDSGYLDPADREVDIILQHLDGVRCTDILSGETVPVTDGRIHVTVPMGTLRIVDVEHQ